MSRLVCCTPERYDGRSRTVVHASTCHKAGKSLDIIELARFVEHPAAKPAPLRLVRLEPLEPHPSCADGTPCSACAPLLHPAGCACDPCGYFDAHADDADDERERVS